ncbi:hypothetical protein Tco_1265987 [Tanacetum coccineum]
MESDEIIKSSVKNLVPIPSELEGIFNDTCDVPVRDDSFTFDALNDNSEILSDSNDDDTSSDDDDFEDIEYVSLEEVNVDQEEKEFDLEDILQIQYVILREKLLNISRLITIIKSLNDNPTPDRVLKSPFSFPIPIEPDQGGLTSVVISDNSNDPLLELPQFESFHFDSVNSHPLFEGGEIKFLQNVEDDDSFTFVMSDFSVLPYSYLPCGFSFTFSHRE